MSFVLHRVLSANLQTCCAGSRSLSSGQGRVAQRMKRFHFDHIGGQTRDALGYQMLTQNSQGKLFANVNAYRIVGRAFATKNDRLNTFEKVCIRRRSRRFLVGVVVKHPFDGWRFGFGLGRIRGACCSLRGNR